MNSYQPRLDFGGSRSILPQFVEVRSSGLASVAARSARRASMC